MKNKPWILFLLILTIMSCDTGVIDQSDNTPDANSIPIGFVAPLTGFGTFGSSVYQGASLAVTEINRAGGINGQKLDLLVRDSAGDGDVGAANVQALIDLGVVAIVGVSFSSTALKSAASTATNNIVLIGATTTSPAISNLDDNDTVYRVAPTDAILGSALTEMMISDGVKNLGIIVNDSAFTLGFSASIQANFPDASAGRRVVAVVTYPETKELGFSMEIDQLFGSANSNNLDGVALLGFSADKANISRDIQLFSPSGLIQYYSNRISRSTFLSDGSASILVNMGAVEKVDIPDWANRDKFEQDYLAHYGSLALDSFRAFQSYDSVYLVALAMAQGQANTRQTVLDNLRSVSGGTGVSTDAVTVNNGEISLALQVINAGGTVDYDGAAGPINFDENGDISVFGFIEQRIIQEQDGSLSVINVGPPQTVLFDEPITP